MIPFLRIRWTTCLGLLLECVLIQQMGASLGVITAFVNFAVSNSSANAATGEITKWTGLHPRVGIYLVTRSVNVPGPSDPWLSFGCLRTYLNKVFFGVTYKLDATADAAGRARPAGPRRHHRQGRALELHLRDVRCRLRGCHRRRQA